MRLPLSATDVVRLRSGSEQAPHGHGLNAVPDASVRRAWQVDATRVSFPTTPDFLTKTAQEIAATALHAMGLGNVRIRVEARLDKLLLCEAGGHFKPHCDTEKEAGMFATLVVQLPTAGGFKGGALVVEQGSGTLTFDYSKHSATGFFYTSFFANCQHTLQQVTAGTRLCLSFKLVRRSVQIGAQILEDSLMVRRVEDALRPWLEASEADEISTFFPTKLAFPLQHTYTPTNLGFSGLKGEDVVLAQVLKSCFDRRLALHLCLATTRDCELPKVRTFNWVPMGYQKMPVYPELNLETEVALGDALFTNKADPDELEDMGYFGITGPSLDYFYHRAMLVVWPKSKIVQTIVHAKPSDQKGYSRECGLLQDEIEVLSLLKMVEEMHKERHPHVRLVLDQVLAHCELDREKIWQRSADGRQLFLFLDQRHDKKRGVDSRSRSTDVSSRLLDVCIAVGGLADVLRVLKLYGERFEVNGREPAPRETMLIGMRTVFVTKSVAAAVRTHGWGACGHLVLELLRTDRVVAGSKWMPRLKIPALPLEGEYYLQLVVELELVKCREAALSVAEKIFNLIFVTVSSTGKSPAPVITAVMKMLVASSEDCLEGHVKSLLQQANLHKQQYLLKKMLLSDHLWNACVVVPKLRDAIRAFTESRLAWIVAHSDKPVFSWCQPYAEFPDHPALEASLRGPEQNFTYHGVRSLSDARHLASFFDGNYSKGFCATGTEGGRGAGAFVVIQKSPKAFPFVLKKWEKQQIEAESLLYNLQYLQELRDGLTQRAPKRVRV